MKLIIAGGRDFLGKKRHLLDLVNIHQQHNVSLVISGACGICGDDLSRYKQTAKGADQLGEFFADNQGIPMLREYAHWKTTGRKDGPLRNERMAKMADALAVFPGGRGTKSMIEIAESQGLKIFKLQ